VTRLWAFRRLTLESTLAEITRHLERYEVRPMVLKGPAFARWLYDDPRERRYGDLDLLVRPDQFAVAMREMVELQFETYWADPNEGAAYAVRLVRPGTVPVIVELHRTLPLFLESTATVWQRLTEGVRTISVAGAPVHVPSPSVSAMIVGLHAAQHSIMAKDVWSAPLLDLDRALDRVDLETWGVAARLASDLGAGPAFGAGLRLDPRGCDVADRLKLGDAPQAAVRRLGSTAAASLGLERLVSTRGAGARLKLLAIKVVPSPAYMRKSSAMAGRGDFGLVAAYLWRPFHLALRVPGGVGTWRRTRVRWPDRIRARGQR